MVDRIRERTLEAAAMLVQEGAADRLTLEAVAGAADLDLAEVRARFPAEADLVIAVARHAYTAFLRKVTAAVGDDDEPGAYVRGYVTASFDDGPEAENFAAVVAALFRTGPIGPETLSSVSQHQRDVDRAVASDGIDPIAAHIIRLAVDGFFMGDVFGWNHFSPTERSAILARLLAMTRQSSAAETAA
jgi:AcrR family transcriptional regulator